jgi:hypothetical protein
MRWINPGFARDLSQPGPIRKTGVSRQTAPLLAEAIGQSGELLHAGAQAIARLSADAGLSDRLQPERVGKRTHKLASIGAGQVSDSNACIPRKLADPWSICRGRMDRQALPPL